MKTLPKKCQTHMCATVCDKDIRCFILKNFNDIEQQTNPYPYFGEPAYTTKSNIMKTARLKMKREPCS